MLNASFCLLAWKIKDFFKEKRLVFMLLCSMQKTSAASGNLMSGECHCFEKKEKIFMKTFGVFMIKFKSNMGWMSVSWMERFSQGLTRSWNEKKYILSIQLTSRYHTGMLFFFCSFTPWLVLIETSSRFNSFLVKVWRWMSGNDFLIMLQGKVMTRHVHWYFTF